MMRDLPSPLPQAEPAEHAPAPRPGLVLGQPHGQDLRAAYPAQGRPPVPTDLDDLAIAVDWEKKRTVWLLLAEPDPATLAQVLSRISRCSRLVVLEPQAAEPPALAPKDQARMRQWLQGGQLYIVTGGDAAWLLARTVELLDIDHFDGWRPILARQRMEQETVEVAGLLRALNERLNSRLLNKGTHLNMGGLFYRNALLNLPWTLGQDTLRAAKGSLKDRPALIVSAGPSLNKQLPLLAEQQHLFTIIAVDTVWPILHRHGIVPDYLCALDAITPPSWPVNGLHPQTCFVTDLIAAPQMVWSHDRGHQMCFANPDLGTLMRSLGGDCGELSTGGSVATRAFELAVHLGCNPLVFIGQDLALTGGRDHAEGYLYTYDEHTLKDRESRGYDVEGYYGGRVRTEQQLLAYKHWFEQRIQTLPETMVINATEGGARIAGSLQIPFAQVCAEIAATSLRKPAHPPAQPERLEPERMAALHAQLGQLLAQVQAFGDLATRGLDLADEAARALKAPSFAAIDAVNEELRQFDGPAKRLVDAIGAKVLEDVRRQTHRQAQSDEKIKRKDRHKAALDRYRQVYERIEICAKATVHALECVQALYQRCLDSGELDPLHLQQALADMR